MNPYVRVHYADLENRVKIEIQWPSPAMMRIAHEANLYNLTTIPYAFFWFDADSDDLITFLDAFPPHEVRENPLVRAARLNEIDHTGTNYELTERLYAHWLSLSEVAS